MIGRLGERAGASFQNYKRHLRKCLYLTEPCFFTWPPRWLANRVSPSMRRPVSVKSVFFPPYKSFLHSSRAASVAILPSALFLSDFRSVQVGRPHFSRCCYLIIDLGSYLSTGAGPGLSRSHLNSAVELGR
jgi:hypothetical protein